MLVSLLNAIDRFFQFLAAPLLLISRLLLAWFFFPAGLEKIQDYSGTASLMSSHGFPAILLPLVILLEMGGAVLLVAGLATRLTCFALAVFTIVANQTYNSGDPNQVREFLYVAEFVTISGMAALMAVGPGAWSLDAFRRKSAAAVEPAARDD
ncbi:MAG: DoxX family protein [Pseudomonadota bacterium]